MVGHSELLIEIQMDKTARELKVTLPFSCLMFKFSFICNYYNLYVTEFEVEIRKNKISLPLK